MRRAGIFKGRQDDVDIVIRSSMRHGMRTIAAESTDAKVQELIEAARSEPVAVTRDGQTAAVVLSPAAFERLDEDDRIRREAKARLRRTIAAIQKGAAMRGMTETELERLLADES